MALFEHTSYDPQSGAPITAICRLRGGGKCGRAVLVAGPAPTRPTRSDIVMRVRKLDAQQTEIKLKDPKRLFDVLERE